MTIKCSGNVLVVDDDFSVRDITRRLLARQGIETIAVDSGEGAIACFEANPDEISLIVMDVTMPGMGGVAAYEALRSMGCAAPVIFSSGLIEAAEEVPLAKGDAYFIHKPFRGADLIAAIQRALDESPAGS